MKPSKGQLLALAWVLQGTAVVLFITALALMEELTPFQMFGLIHQAASAIAQSILVYRVRKKQILLLGIAMPVVSVVAISQLLWECGAVYLAVKLIGVTAFSLGVMLIRKLVARLLSGKAQGHVTPSLPQKLNFASSITVSILNFIFSASVFLEVLNLLNWLIFLCVAWYYYGKFVFKMKENFTAVATTSAAAESSSGSNMNSAINQVMEQNRQKKMRKAEKNIRVNMRGCVAAITLGCLFFFLHSPLWQAEEAQKCQRRYGVEEKKVILTSFCIMMVAFVLTHAMFWQTIFMMKNKKKKKSTFTTQATILRSGRSGMSGLQGPPTQSASEGEAPPTA